MIGFGLGLGHCYTQNSVLDSVLGFATGSLHYLSPDSELDFAPDYLLGLSPDYLLNYWPNYLRCWLRRSGIDYCLCQVSLIVGISPLAQ